MKVAVCISGICRSLNSLTSVKRNNEVQKSKFPTADFYYATWNDYKDEFLKNFKEEKGVFFEQPQMHYHPYLDVVPPKGDLYEFFNETKGWIQQNRKVDWSLHHTKQILIHAFLLDSIPDDYDVIVRTRFDGFIHHSAEFEPFIKDTFEKKRPNCFSATKKPFFDTFRELTSEYHPKMNYWMCDQLIIHRRDMFDTRRVMKLHEDRKLLPAEYGWYQVLSEPYGSNHKNFGCWVNHDKNILSKFFKG